MADYSNNCKCGRYQHAEWCTSHYNYQSWKDAQDQAAEFAQAVHSLDFTVKETWLVCNICYTLLDKSRIAARTHRRKCEAPRVGGMPTAQDIKDLING